MRIVNTLAALCLPTALCAQIAAGPVSGPAPHRLHYDRHEIQLEADTNNALKNDTGEILAPTPEGELDALPYHGPVDYLGWGCDGYTGTDKLLCISGIDAKMRPGKAKNGIVYQEVRTKSELKELTKRDFMASGSVEFGSWGISANMASQFEEKVQITDENITLVGKLDYLHGTLVINNPRKLVIPEDIKELYRKNYAEFFKDYGDGFVSKVDLGESLYFVCQTRVHKSSKYTRSEIQAAMEAKFCSIVNIGASGTQIKDMDLKLAESSFSLKVFNTGTGFVGQLVNDKDAFNGLIDKFQKHINDKESTGAYSALRSYITPYAYVMENTKDPAVAANITKLMKWYDLRNKIMAVLEKYGPESLELSKRCEAAMKEIDIEAEKCRTKQPDAKEPRSDAHWDLQLKWINLYSEPLARGESQAQFWPYVITSFMPMEPQLADKCSLLGAKILTKPLEGYECKKVYYAPVGGTVSQFNLGPFKDWPMNHPTAVLSTLISTDEFDVKKNAFNPGSAFHIGYVLASPPLSLENKPLKGFKPLYRIGGNCCGTCVRTIQEIIDGVINKQWVIPETPIFSIEQKVFEYATDERSAQNIMEKSKILQSKVIYDPGGRGRAILDYKTNTTFTTKTLVGYVPE